MNNSGAADTGADDTSNNVIVMKALLRNELLYDQIDDIRVSVSWVYPLPPPSPNVTVYE